MRLDRSELYKAVKAVLSLGAAVAAGVAGTAQAQNQTPAQSDQAQNPKTLQTVVVTGSHIRRVDLETASPVIALSSQAIQQTGKLTLGEVMQQLPVITGGMKTPTVNNSNHAGPTPAGRTLVGLRGLGASRTLVLIDGQRVLNADMNTIPSAAVERIEVLTDGASSVYGSDAIGGVINVILKSNYQGAEFSTNYGISDHDDGERKGVSFMFGQSSDKGSILAGVSYNQFDEILQSARKFSENALSLTADGPGMPPYVVAGGSTSAPRGNIGVPASIDATLGCAQGVHLSLNQDAANAGTSPTSLSDFHCFGHDDRYNYATMQALLTPQERTNAFFKGSYHLSDNVDAYMTVLMNKTAANIQLAPGIFSINSALPISKDSYYNPFGIDFTRDNGNTLGVRAVPGGNRITGNGAYTVQSMVGLRGNATLFGQDWTWDVGMDYGHWSYVSRAEGMPNASLLADGLGPSFLNSDGVVQCGTAADPVPLSSCTPWDPFNLYSDSAKAAFQQASTPALINVWNIQRTYHADVSGGLFDLPAGTAQLAAGVSYRKEYTNNTVSSDLQNNLATGSCPLGSQCSAHLQGGFNVKEAYAELFLPLLKDMPFAQALNVTLGDRFSKYNLVGSTNNWKVALEYRPIGDLLLRGTVSTVFRAPTISDMFATPAGSTSSLSSDPCDGITAPNPACQNVPLDGSFRNTTVANHGQGGGLFAGATYLNFPIKPEEGKSFDFGLVYSPHFVPGLSVSADIWRIYLNDTITNVGEQSVLDLCYNGVERYCPLIQRFGPEAGSNAGQINQIYLPTTNLGRIDVQGVDMQVNYRLPDFGIGQFTLGLNATYMKQFKIQIAPDVPAANRVINGAGAMGSTGTALQSACPFNLGGICFFPRVRAQTSVDWQLGPWDASWRTRISSPFQIGSDDPSQQSTAIAGIPGVILHYGTYVYNDLTIGYSIQPINTRISVGVDNMFDKQPPMLYANNSLNANTDPEDFDVIGRYYWARLNVKF